MEDDEESEKSASFRLLRATLIKKKVRCHGN